MTAFLFLLLLLIVIVVAIAIVIIIITTAILRTVATQGAALARWRDLSQAAGLNLRGLATQTCDVLTLSVRGPRSPDPFPGTGFSPRVVF